VLRYGHTQNYGPHMDVLNDPNKRIGTVVMYLSDVEFGGETVFPHGQWIDPSQIPDQETLSECAKGKVGVKPKKGALPPCRNQARFLSTNRGKGCEHWGRGRQQVRCSAPFIGTL
jgi:2OG-Fe(II) oxygenase superfamily